MLPHAPKNQIPYEKRLFPCIPGGRAHAIRFGITQLEIVLAGVTTHCEGR